MRLGNKLLVGGILPTLVVVGAGLFLLASLSQATNGAREASRNAEELTQLGALTEAAANAEQSYHLFKLTGDQAVLAPYYAEVTRFQVTAQGLSRLLTRDPEQAADLAEVRSGMARWVTRYASPSIDALATNGSAGEASQSSPSTVRRENAVIDGVFADLRRLTLTEQVQQRAVLADVAHAQSVARVVAIIGLLGILGIGLLTTLLMTRSVHRRAGKIEEAARARGAGSRNARASLAGTDELARVAKAFNDMADRMEVLEREDLERLTTATQRELRSGQERLRLLSVGTQDVAFRIRITPHTKVDFVTDSILRLAGFSPEELRANPDLLFDRVHPDDRDFIDQLATGTGFTGTHEARFTRSDDRIIWTEWELFPAFDDEGNVNAVEGVVRDISERVAMHEALRESEERYRGIVDAMSEGVILRDHTGRIVTANRAAEDILGMGTRDLVSRTDYMGDTDPIHEDGTPYLDGEMASQLAMATGEPVRDLVMGLLRPDGQRRWVSASAVPIKGLLDGDPGVIVTFADVTERKAAYEAQRTADALARSILGASPEAIISTDRLGRIVHFNPMAESMFQVSEGDVLGLRVSEVIVPEEFRAAHDRGIESFAATGGGAQFGRPRVLRGKRNDGSEFPIELTLVQVPGLDEPLLTAFIQDISERVTRQEELRTAEERYRRLVEHLPACAYLEVTDPADPKGYRDAYIGPQATRILGRDPSEWMEDPDFWMKILHPDDRDLVIAETARSTQAQESYQQEYRIVHPDGSIRWIRDIAWSILDAGGGVGGWQGLLFDITDEREAQEERVARSTAERANLAKSEFLSRVSHELRTPLNAVLGFAQLMQLDELTADQQESVGQILRGGQHLLDLINEVLDLTRIEAGEMRTRLEPVDPLDAARTAIELLGPLAAEHEVSIKVHEPAHAVPVSADRQRLRQIIINLLSNAIKYNKSGGRIDISISAAGERIVAIEVADTGRGISADSMEEIFAPFERLDAERTDIEGTGLGLPLARSFAASMDGTLAVKSTVGVGSTFTLTLPAWRADRSLAGSGGTAPTILCIDDNEGNLALVEQLLTRRNDVSLLSARDGATGLAMAREYVPSLVLLDLHLPDMSGEAVLAAIRSDQDLVETRVVIATAEYDEALEIRMHQLGAESVLRKPIDVQELLALADGVAAGRLA